MQFFTSSFTQFIILSFPYLMFGFVGDRDKIQKTKPNNVFNTETMLPISEIRGDTVILKDGGLRAILRLTGVNLDLRNFDEQTMVAEQYKRFLNGLDFPIQIMVRNTYLELSDFITYVRGNVNQVDRPLLKDQWDAYVDFLEQINAKQGLVFAKEFYLVIPYYPLEDDTEGVRKPRWKKFLDALNRQETPEKIVSRYRIFLKNSQYLETRVNVALEGLKGVGIYGQRMGMVDIIGLLFKSYNPDSHKDQAVRTA